MSVNGNAEVRIVTSLPGRARALWTPEPCVTDFESYVAWLHDHNGKGDKYSRPYLAGTLRRAPGRRRNDNLLLRFVATLDADEADEGFPERARKVLGPLGIRAELHTTASHDADKGKHRWRVLIPFDRGAEPAEYLSLTMHLIKMLGLKHFDKQASTSPAHIAYAPATPGVQWVSLPGKAMPLDDWAEIVEPLPWAVTDSIGAITLDEWREAHADQEAACHYGRTALDGMVNRLEGTEEGHGVHTACFHAARRAVELVGAGCWNLDDVDTLAAVALGLRKEQRPNEFREALVSALTKGDQAKTECGIHLQDLEPWDGDDLGSEDSDDLDAGLQEVDLAAWLDPDRPPRQWLLDGLVPTGDQVAIVAPGGTGKSLFVLGLALAAVCGTSVFVGRRLVFDGRVFYVDMENSEHDWVERLRSYGWDQESIARIASRFHVLSLPPLAGLDTKRGAAQLKRWLISKGAKAGDLLVLDSMQRITEGEENSNDTLRALYTLTSSWLKSLGVTVIRTDNTGKDESLGARGASAKRDDVGYAYTLRAKGSRFTLTSDKHRAAGDGDQVVFDRVLDTETGYLAWEPVGNEAVSDFDELQPVQADLVLAAWLLTDPSSGRNYQDDWVSQSQLTVLAVGNAQVKRAALEALVTTGHLRKTNLQNANGEKAKNPSFGLDDKGRAWIDENGERWRQRLDLLTARWEEKKR